LQPGICDERVVVEQYQVFAVRFADRLLAGIRDADIRRRANNSMVSKPTCRNTKSVLGKLLPNEFACKSGKKPAFLQFPSHCMQNAYAECLFERASAEAFPRGGCRVSTYDENQRRMYFSARYFKRPSWFVGCRLQAHHD
jgi:hypothetical protein